MSKINGNQKKDKAKVKKTEETRYNEKQAFITHLSSGKGIDKLLTTLQLLYKDEKCESPENHKNTDANVRDVFTAADEILDILKTWVDDFPCKKFYKMSYYEIFAKLEKYCDDKEIAELFDFLL